MKPPDLFLALHSAHPVPLTQSFHRSILNYLHLKHQCLQSSIPILSHVESVSSLHVTCFLSGLLILASYKGCVMVSDGGFVQGNLILFLSHQFLGYPRPLPATLSTLALEGRKC